jgi:hypothetical protein
LKTETSAYHPLELGAIAAARVSWDTLTDEELLTAYVAATFGDARPTIRPEVLAYGPALKLGLIDENGFMHDLVFRALEVAVVRILEGGAQGLGVRFSEEETDD